MKKVWPLWFATAAYFVALGVLLAIILGRTHGHQLYPLDDTYIHAAVAKNLALHGVYGITRYHSSFPCSSILWPFLIAFTFLIVGVHVWVPFVLNIAISLFILWFSYRLLRRVGMYLTPALEALFLLLLVCSVPLVGMTFLGMEHLFHLLASLLLLGSYEAATRPKPARGAAALLVLASFLVTGARYEGLFAVLLVCGLLAVKSRWKLAFAAGSSALLLVVAFGLYGLSQGSTFLPSPLLIKTAGASKFSPLTWLHNLFGRHALISGVTLVFLLCCVLLIYLQKSFPHQHSQLKHWLLILLGVFLLHAQFAQFGGFFRYEAYLIGAGIVVIFAGVSALMASGTDHAFSREAQLVAKVLLVLTVLGLGARAAIVFSIIPEQTYGVYAQQYQVAAFLGQHYAGQGVALNDIGAPNYFDDIRCLDLWGLGSVDVERLRVSGTFDRDAIDRLTTTGHVQIAVLYRSWFTDKIPARWVPVEDWQVTDLKGHSVLGGDTVTFYAVDPSEAPTLARNLLDFDRQLPPGVRSKQLWTASSAEQSQR
ncbi:hypothetical protein [Granulicella mallensis]|uniref:Glycosyltransferase RgtA/B/C/D-like domain-containing protein n=1 Tax=Granulicella mallensis TaxID=940614 RepID=A0A7W7ZMQ4_9BACT|nr:hypothetical protein [Granulicella mallensis]MBB5062442.1 hypothetical protein [Granulicella mallensis]